MSLQVMIVTIISCKIGGEKTFFLSAVKVSIQLNLVHRKTLWFIMSCNIIHFKDFMQRNKTKIAFKECLYQLGFSYLNLTYKDIRKKKHFKVPN